MRVVHLSPFFDMHLGYEEFYTAKYMSKKGWDVTILTTKVSNDNSIKYTKPAETTQYGFKIIRLPCLFRYGSDFVYMKQFRKTFCLLKPDLVYMHGNRLPQYKKIVKMRKKKKFVLFADHHDFFYPGHSMMPSRNSIRNLSARIEYHYFRRFISKYILNRVDKIFPVTKVCKDHLTAYFKIPETRIVPMELPVDAELFYFDKKKRNEIRKDLKLTENDFVLNFTGIFTRRKKFEKIINLIHELKKENLDKKITILIVGYFREKDYENEIKEQIKKSGFSDCVYFVGKVQKENIKDYYSATDAAFWLENNSISILEAMACGCIVFVPDMQLSHYVNGNGIVFEPGNILQLSNEISKFSKLSQKDLEIKKTKSLELVKNKHNYEIYVDKIFHEYKKITESIQH